MKDTKKRTLTAAEKQEKQIRADIAALKTKEIALRAKLPAKVVHESVNVKKKFKSECNNELLSWSKVSKIVHKKLNGMTIESFKEHLKPDELKRFNQSQFDALVKSAKLVCNMFTEKQYNDIQNDDKSISVTLYENTIIKGACFIATTFDKRRKQGRKVPSAKKAPIQTTSNIAQNESAKVKVESK